MRLGQFSTINYPQVGGNLWHGVSGSTFFSGNPVKMSTGNQKGMLLREAGVGQLEN